MKKYNYSDSPAYRRWVAARDKALEHLHANAQLESTDVMNKALSDVLHQSANYFHSNKDQSNLWSIDNFEHQVKNLLRNTALSLYKIQDDLLHRTYVLAKTSETEIIAQLNPGRAIANKISRRQMKFGASQEELRSLYSFIDRLSRKIVSQVQSATINQDTLEDFLQRIVSVFPKRKSANSPRRILKPVTKTLIEADKTPKADVAIDYIDEETWNQIVDAYKADYIPKWRSPEYIIDIPTKEGDVWYAWEFERDITHEFVQAVRSGQIDSANESGITDFVWIAIIDGSTCDNCCGEYGCVDFDGMLTSEIEKMTGGENSVPPAHFSCRCTFAPATDNIPAKPDDGASSFDDWLMS